MSTNNKIFVLDTSVILSEGKRTFALYPGSTLVIPLVVLHEVENKRTDLNLGYSARHFLRELESIRGKGSLSEGITLHNGTTVRVELNHVNNPDVISKMADPKSADSRIISVAYSIKMENKDCEVTLLSKDIPLKIQADLRGVKSEDSSKAPNNREFIDETVTIDILDDEMDELYEYETIKLDANVPINTGVILKSPSGSSALAISKSGYRFTLIKDQSIKRLNAKSKEQNFALKMLKDDSIKCVSLGGIAGGGKSLLALAAGVEAVEKGEYKKVVVFRSMQAVGGEELGYLPGTEQEKMDPWTAAVWDALDSYLDHSAVAKLKTNKVVEVLPITHVRGRTLSNAYIIVDEAQNLSRDTIMTLLTRTSHSSKIVMTHDVSQRDNVRVSRWDGIYEVVARMHGNKLFGHVAMKKSERSELAQEATRLLDTE